MVELSFTREAEPLRAALLAAPTAALDSPETEIFSGEAVSGDVISGEVISGAAAGGDTETVARVGGWDSGPSHFLNRELSWLAFAARVLQQAADPAVPLLEQTRYLAIFSNILDEFFQVRLAGLDDQVAAGITRRSADGRTPAEQLEAIREVVEELCDEQQRLYLEQIEPSLAGEGIALLGWQDLDTSEQAAMSRHYQERVFGVLTPLAVDPGHPFPFISDLSLNLGVLMRDPDSRARRFARVKVPPKLDRWVRVGRQTRFLALEELIAAHLESLFPGMEILEHHVFRVTRNADLTIDSSGAEDLLAAVEMELRRRRFQRTVRLQVSDTMSDEVLDRLLRELDLVPEVLFRTAGPVDLSGLHVIAGLGRTDLAWPEWRGITEPALASGSDPTDFFEVLRQGDVLVHHPYSSFSRSVVELVHQASIDPAVLTIKLTLYRTSGASPIVEALVNAAERGKQVAALVELKARFDEAANIGWAKRLEQAGVHVAYGLIGLKIHAKTMMIVREEPEGIRRYCHIGTGNYDHRTARLYEDIGLLTADPEVGADLALLFNQLTGYGRNIEYSRLIVAPEQLRARLEELIDAEIASGRGRMIMKMNALVDPAMIEKLYEASQAGVEIDIIVRAACSLKPGLEGLSERIRVRSIVGRYLEHSRIYHFAHGNGLDQPATYIGSADIMNRNLSRRVEVLVRLVDPETISRVHEIMEVALSDDRRAWTLDVEGVWTRGRGPVGVDHHETLQSLALARAGS